MVWIWQNWIDLFKRWVDKVSQTDGWTGRQADRQTNKHAAGYKTPMATGLRRKNCFVTPEKQYIRGELLRYTRVQWYPGCCYPRILSESSTTSSWYSHPELHPELYIRWWRTAAVTKMFYHIGQGKRSTLKLFLSRWLSHWLSKR